MTDSTPCEIELTPDLLDYAKRVAIKEATKCCSKRVDYDDVVSDAVVNLIRNPPKHDPSRGASVKTLIYTIVQRAVIKFAAREVKHARRFRQFPFETSEAEVDDGAPDPQAGTVDARERMVGLMDTEASDGKAPSKADVGRRASELTSSRYNLDDILEFIDDAESRQLCLLFLECGGNISATARRMGVVEGTIRHRLKLLAPKLVAAGFNPFRSGDTS